MTPKDLMHEGHRVNTEHKIIEQTGAALTALRNLDIYEAAAILHRLATDVTKAAKRTGPRPVKPKRVRPPRTCFDCGGDLTEYRVYERRTVSRNGQKVDAHFDCSNPETKRSKADREAEERRKQERETEERRRKEEFEERMALQKRLGAMSYSERLEYISDTNFNGQSRALTDIHGNPL